MGVEEGMKLPEAKRYIDEVGMNEVRRTLQAKRESAGLSQLGLAKISKIRQSNINRIESGKQAVTPRTFARLMTALETVSTKQSKQIEDLTGLRTARERVALYERLPFLQDKLPDARAQLAKLEAESGSNKDILSNPIVRGLLESYGREIEMLEEALNVFSVIYGPTAGKFALGAIDRYKNGEEGIVKAYDEWKKTGNNTLSMVIDKVTKVVE
jgi:transcriptional regulator with XRE-family HTH domain